MKCAIYLRRSRADEEAEARGEGETLSRHRTALLDLARRMNLSIVEIYQEIASGDTISGRPEMRRLLADVSARKYDGVLCMAVDRLGRGDSMDQGYIMQTFLYSGTKIITPEKTYDPSNQTDFEFFEMRQFFARREYTSIKGRMQAGRELASKEGYFVGSRAPYGYQIVQTPDKRSYTLDILPDQADVVRSIFDWYVNGLDGKEIGCYSIAVRLNEMQIPNSLGNKWIESTVRNLIGNPVYIGYVTWGKKKTRTEMADGHRIQRRLKNSDYIRAKGMHEPIVDEELWNAANNIMRANFKGHVGSSRETAFVLSGLCKCGVCGKAIIRQANYNNPKYDIIKCSTPNCPTHGSYISTIENLIIAQLDAWAVQVPNANVKDTDSVSDRKSQLEKQLTTLANQQNKLHDLLEQGVYDVPTFLQRQRVLAEKESALRDQLNELSKKTVISTDDAIARLAPAIRNVLDAYSTAASVSEKNCLLKSVISRIVYSKPRRRYKNEAEYAGITLDIYPRID